jgi:small-conductance mechanosensitive channel
VPAHPTAHFFWTIAFLCVEAAATALVRARVTKRRLLFSEALLLIALAIHAAILRYPDARAQAETVEYFVIVVSVISGLVTLSFNPWFRDRVHGEGVPAIVQDSTTAILAGVASLFVFQSSSFIVGITGSAIVLGLALQDTLGNAFAGLAIQIERPFRVGHWVKAGDYDGRVIEITWRATKIRTKSGNLVVLPNSAIAQQPINNYSQPTAPTRLDVDVGIAYETPPNEAREAIFAAIRRVRRVLTEPGPDVLLVNFGDSAISYRARFWIDEFDKDEITKSDVRIAIYYELRRRNIEIPWPIQVQYDRVLPPVDTPDRREAYRQLIAAVPVLAPLPESAHGALAMASAERLFADGEVIVREGDPGTTMFLVRSGCVVVTVGPEAREVAVTEAGGYFGEMSLLTGAPRTATVTARGDCLVLEISGAAFRDYVQSNPGVIERLAEAAEARRKALESSRGPSSAVSRVERESLATRMRRFFGLDE